MTVDVEQTLRRELHQVADGLAVPQVPTFAAERTSGSRRWLALAAAAAVVVAGAGAFALSHHDDSSPQPAPSPAPAPSVPNPTGDPTTRLSRTEPTIPYVVGQVLHVGGHRVPGTWFTVESGARGWLAWRSDHTWWWGSGSRPTPHALTLTVDEPPVISPNGRYVGLLSDEQGGLLTGFDTRPAGEGLGGVPIDLGDRQRGTAVTVRAVLDDGRVIAQGSRTSVLWRPLVDDRTVDLSRTAPDQFVVGSTPVGLIVTDGEEGPSYLADISGDGILTRTLDLPDHDDLAVSTEGSWLAWTPAGTTQGEVVSTRTLRARTVNGTGDTRIRPPKGYAFAVRAWAWEDDTHVVARVVDPSGAERMARCVLPSARCVLARTS